MVASKDELHIRAARFRAKSGDLRERSRDLLDAKIRAEFLDLTGQYDEMAVQLEEIAKLPE
jgi:hypothetical protein